MAASGQQGDDAFVATLDAAQEYMAAQAALAGAMRAGFLSLAQARYSMGPDRVSALQFPSHMRASTRVHADGGELALAVADPAAPSSAQPSPSSSGSGGWAKADAEAPAAARSGAAGSNAGGDAGAAPHGAAAAAAPVAAGQRGGGAAAEEGLEAQLQRLRLAAQESDGILQSLAAKYGCSDGGGGGAAAGPGSSSGGGGSGGRAGEDDDYAEVPAPGRPLSWFGSLVAPSLREAEAQFSGALAAAVTAANAQRRVLAGVDGLRGSGDGKA